MAIRADSSNYRNRNNQDPRDFVSRPGRGGEDDDRGRIDDGQDVDEGNVGGGTPKPYVPPTSPKQCRRYSVRNLDPRNGVKVTYIECDTKRGDNIDIPVNGSREFCALEDTVIPIRGGGIRDNNFEIDGINDTNVQIVDKGECVDPPTPIPPNRVSKTVDNDVTINFISNQSDAEIIENDSSTKARTRETIVFTAKQLLSAKTFRLNKNGYNSPEYKVIAIPQSITKRAENDIITFTYYDIAVERRNIGENRFLQVKYIRGAENENIKKESFDLTLDFNLQKRPTPPPPPPLTSRIIVRANTVRNNTIGYRLSNGTEGVIVDGTNTIEAPLGNSSYIEFFNTNNEGVNLRDFSVDFNVKRQGETRSVNIFEFQQEYDQSGLEIDVTLTKDNAPPRPSRPSLTLPRSNYSYSLTSSTSLPISVRTSNTDRIRISIGGIQREVSNRDIISISKNEFSRGVGQYKVLLQPISNDGGSGDTKTVVVNVSNIERLEGPDIRVINYPRVIDGEDFKGFNVSFDIDWNSVGTNFVKLYVGQPNNDYLVSGNLPGSGKTRLNVNQLLKRARKNYDENTDQVQFKLFFVPYNTQGDSVVTGRVEEAIITFNRGLRVRRKDLVGDLRQAFNLEVNPEIFKEDTSKLLTHQLHFGNGDKKLAATFATDTQTLDSDSLVVKLYEPLPTNIETEQPLWISKVQSVPLIDEIEVIDDEVKVCRPLRPNFNVDVNDEIGYQILDQLVASGSATTNDLLREYVSSSEFNLTELDLQFTTGSGSNLDYNWEGFVKYSSAAERTANFFYKVKLVESYQNDINFLSASIDDGTGSVSIRNEKISTETKKEKLLAGFDAFEKFLYEETGSLSYSKQNGSLVSTTSSIALDWYNLTASFSANEYDRNNVDLISNNIPLHIKNDENGQEFVLFFDMIGQHFDLLYNYIKSVKGSKLLEHKVNKGIPNDLLYHQLESLGWDADLGVKSQFLWEYGFGKNKDGTNRTNTLIDGTVQTIPTGQQRQYEIWRRLLNNIPYLLKHKGTQRALKAALACYGIPNSLLTILEFGGPSETDESTKKLTIDDRTATLNIDTGYVQLPWKTYTSGSITDYPNSVELRVETSRKERQTIVSASKWSLDIVPNTGSLATFEYFIESSSIIVSQSTNPIPFYDDEYTNFVINRTESGGNDTIDIYVKEGFQGRIRNEASASITVPTGSWEDGSHILFGTDFTGSIDELRLWRIPLDEASIDNHTLIPDAVDGVSYRASTDDLLFRNDFEFPRNLGVTSSTGIASGSIKNVAINQSYTSASDAIGFTTKSSYPYNYTTIDRTVTATVPSIGNNYGNKFRFETQTKTGDLSYRSRSTVKSFDQSPVDSNRLGLFFSPVKEINLDIIKSLGRFNINDYIGDPSDLYEERYEQLDELREYYFDRYNLNFTEYIQLVRSIDRTIYTTLESLAPARARVSKGLLIEPHFLERSKVKYTKPTGLRNDFGTRINVEEDVHITMTNPQFTSSIDTQQDVFLYVSASQLEATVNANDDVHVVGDYRTYTSSIVIPENTLFLKGSITRNSGSTMGGIEISIDAQITGSLIGQVVGQPQTQVGLDPDSPFVRGFGIYAEDGDAIRTYYDVFGNLVKERVKVFTFDEEYNETIEQTVSGSFGYENELFTQTLTRRKVSIIPFTGSNGSESLDLQEGNGVTNVVALNGYLPSHFRYVSDRTTGLENSYNRGSKQTSATTVDGTSPVETFTTNPNTLRVTDTGRGSGEPILEID